MPLQSHHLSRIIPAEMLKLTVNPAIAPDIIAEFDEALRFLGVESRNHGLAEMIRALVLQARAGEVIAWPPEFVAQDRSNAAYIEERRSFAKERSHIADSNKKIAKRK